MTDGGAIGSTCDLPGSAADGNSITTTSLSSDSVTTADTGRRIATLDGSLTAVQFNTTAAAAVGIVVVGSKEYTDRTATANTGSVITTGSVYDAAVNLNIAAVNVRAGLFGGPIIKTTSATANTGALNSANGGDRTAVDGQTIQATLSRPPPIPAP